MFKPKPAKKEYLPSMLPKNRKEVFFDVLKLNWGRFILYGFLVLLISLPMHASVIFGDFYSASISEALDTGKITAVQAVSMATSSSNTLALVDILFCVIFAVGFSGLAHIMRQHAWEESVYFRHEYIKGIKQNAGSFALLGLLVGIIKFACTWFGNYLMLHNGNAFAYAGYIPAAIFAIFLAPPAAYMTVCVPIYGVKFHQNFKTALMLYFKSFFKTIFAVLICALPFVVQMIPNFYCHLIGRIVSSLATPFIMLGWFVFTYEMLDKTINPKLYPQLVGKGVYKEEPKEEKTEEKTE